MIEDGLAGPYTEVMTKHSITLERGRALLHALKRADSPAELEAFAELAKLRERWQWRRMLRNMQIPRSAKGTFHERKATRIATLAGMPAVKP